MLRYFALLVALFLHERLFEELPFLVRILIVVIGIKMVYF